MEPGERLYRKKVRSSSLQFLQEKHLTRWNIRISKDLYVYDVQLQLYEGEIYGGKEQV